MPKVPILVVEDDVELCNAYKIILESVGHRVITAPNGKEALKLLNESIDPSIIFLDLKMAEMDGIEFLKYYNAFKHPDTTIVLFSNYDDQKKVKEAFTLGAERYVLKARANPNELIRMVSNILADKAKD